MKEKLHRDNTGDDMGDIMILCSDCDSQNRTDSKTRGNLSKFNIEL